jgi:hypothetical protein
MLRFVKYRFFGNSSGELHVSEFLIGKQLMVGLVNNISIKKIFLIIYLSKSRKLVFNSIEMKAFYGKPFIKYTIIKLNRK